MRATFLATAAAGCFLAVSAAASTLTPTPTAMVSYLGNGSQYNDSATNAFVIDFIDNYTPFDSSTLVQLDRVNSPNLNEGGILSVSYTGGAPSTMGSWTSTSAISIVAYKNGAGFTMAYYSPSVTSATWDTGLLGLLGPQGQPQNISHITAYGAQKTPTVPLPAAAWMLIAGLGSLLGLRRFTA
ncbi:MAG: VPLPA-CTERM sorting domain-containing protein [Rhodobacteraceae bacterium]|nr:VPLPA-CTERM sorting domain-containing protein [Paracoccaceae bacterium]